MEVAISLVTMVTIVMPILAEPQGIWEIMRSPRLREDNYISKLTRYYQER